MKENGIIQVGVIVRDIEKAAEFYASVFDVPTPKINQVRPQELTNAMYRGKPMMSRAKLCAFKLGAVQVELCEPDGEDSVWKEILDERGEGVGFLGFNVADAKAVTERIAGLGVEVLHRGDTPGGSYNVTDFRQLGVSLNIKDRKVAEQ